MNSEWLQYFNFVLQLIAVVLVGIYTVLTYRIMKSASKQVGVSQEQSAAMLEQMEIAQRPCLTLSASARIGEDAILNIGGIEGAQVLHALQGRPRLINVGPGPAFNIRYSAAPTDPASTGLARPSGYLVHMLPGEPFALPIGVGILGGSEWNFTMTYESRTGRKYQTKLVINDLVLTSFNFEPVKPIP
jgi:hypothetical protein